MFERADRLGERSIAPPECQHLTTFERLAQALGDCTVSAGRFSPRAMPIWGDRREAARHYPSGRAERWAVSQPRGPRALSGRRWSDSVDRACAYPIDPERAELGGKALHHALNAAEHAGIDTPSRRRALTGETGDQGDRARLPDMRIGGADRLKLAPEADLESRACLFVGKLHNLLVQQRIADRHRQVIECAESSKEPLEHRLVSDIDAFAACSIAEPEEGGWYRTDRPSACRPVSTDAGAMAKVAARTAAAAQIAGHSPVQPDVFEARAIVPDVFEARAIVDAVDHLGHPLHPRLV